MPDLVTRPAEIVVRLSLRAFAEFAGALADTISWYDPDRPWPNRVFELSGGGLLVVTIFDDRRDNKEIIMTIPTGSRLPITDAQIENWFTYHNDPANTPKFQAINDAAIALAKVIRDNTPVCADQMAAFRLVREARMTANAAIACKGL